MPLNYLQPSVEIGNLRIDEPITTITDLVFAGVCFYAFIKLRKHKSPGRVKLFFTYYFLTLGLGAFTGGLLGHAFLYRLSPEWQLVSWILCLISVALIAHALLELAKPVIKPGLSRWMARINLLILAIAVFYTLWNLVFLPVTYYSIFGMVVVVGSLSLYIFQKTGNKGTVRVMVAVAVGLLSAFVFLFKWGVSPWFNHNDISHIILSFSALLIYTGVLWILKAPNQAT